MPPEVTCYVAERGVRQVRGTISSWILTPWGVLFMEVSSFQGVLIRGVPAVLFIEVSSFQGVLIRGVPAVLFIEVSSFQGVLIREDIAVSLSPVFLPLH